MKVSELIQALAAMPADFDVEIQGTSVRVTPLRVTKLSDIRAADAARGDELNSWSFAGCSDETVVIETDG